MGERAEQPGRGSVLIPDEAVEAAAKAHLGARGEAKWGDLTQMGRRNRLYWMRAALEAALPHLK